MGLGDDAAVAVRAHVAGGLLPGAVLGVATSAGVAGVEAFGDARADDAYPLFSITKPLVGLAAARLLESGALTLDTPLTAAVSAFAGVRDDPVLVRHLASHTSGIPEPPLDCPVPLREALLAPGRDFAAGTVSRYSSLGFEGIAALMEHADGRAWEAQLADALAAVGAGGITLDTAATAHPPVTHAAATLDWDRFAALRHPGAGAVGTAADLLAVAMSLLRGDGRIVRPDTVAAMRRPLAGGVPSLAPYPPASGTTWGFTWNLRVSPPGAVATDGFGHSGWTGTELWIHPDHDVAWVLLANVAGAGTLGMDCTALDNAVIASR